MIRDKHSNENNDYEEWRKDLKKMNPYGLQLIPSGGKIPPDTSTGIIFDGVADGQTGTSSNDLTVFSYDKNLLDHAESTLCAIDLMTISDFVIRLEMTHIPAQSATFSLTRTSVLNLSSGPADFKSPNFLFSNFYTIDRFEGADAGNQSGTPIPDVSDGDIVSIERLGQFIIFKVNEVLFTTWNILPTQVATLFLSAWMNIGVYSIDPLIITLL